MSYSLFSGFWLTQSVILSGNSAVFMCLNKGGRWLIRRYSRPVSFIASLTVFLPLDAWGGTFKLRCRSIRIHIYSNLLRNGSSSTEKTWRWILVFISWDIWCATFQFNEYIFIHLGVDLRVFHWLAIGAFRFGVINKPTLFVRLEPKLYNSCASKTRIQELEETIIYKCWFCGWSVPFEDDGKRWSISLVNRVTDPRKIFRELSVQVNPRSPESMRLWVLMRIRPLQPQVMKAFCAAVEAIPMNNR